jgi:pyruvate formate lyase activating enzyme
LISGEHVIDWSKCKSCGECVEECFSKAVELVGSVVTVDDVLNEVLKDKVFFENSKGGMTISGGEPLSQPEFTKELLRKAKRKRIHTALDTCGYANWSILGPILEHVDLVLYDIKHMNSRKHKEYTGVSNELILENLKKIDVIGKQIWVRIPLIPSLNDSDSEFRQIGEYLSEIEHLERVDVLRYHKMAERKYEHTGQDYSLKGLETPDKEQVERHKMILMGYGLKNIHIS